MIRKKQATFLLFAVLALAVIAALSASPARAQDPTPVVVTDDQVNAVAKNLYCPVCENIPLDVCPTQACAEWRELIRQKLQEGMSEAQVRQFFADEYGVRVLNEPPARGFFWLIYLAPPLAILAGAVVVYRVIKKWSKPAPAAERPGARLMDAPAAPGSIPGSSDEYIKRLEEELKKREANS